MSYRLAALVFFATALLEVGWVGSVRLVSIGGTVSVPIVAMVMQTIAYVGILPVVKDRRLSVMGVLGAGVGALAGMLLPIAEHAS